MALVDVVVRDKYITRDKGKLSASESGKAFIGLTPSVATAPPSAPQDATNAPETTQDTTDAPKDA
jgi:hypothetical protein